MTVLTTKRLKLRAAQDDDLAPLFAIYSNPVAMKFWDSKPHETPEDTKPLVNRLRTPKALPYLVWDLDGTAIGTGGVHRDAEIGFVLHPDYWGMGFAREALSSIIDHIWETSDLLQIVAEADPRNLASVGLMTRLGFQVTGYASKNFYFAGKWSDSVYLRLPKPS